MYTISFKYDTAAIIREFELSMDRDVRLKAAIDNVAYQIFRRAHDIMLKTFDEHLVTKELKAGPLGDNLSVTVGGYGNLFAFLGFDYAAPDPTEELRAYLVSLGSARLVKTTRKNTVVYYRTPLIEEEKVREKSKTLWGDGRSWAYSIQTGDFSDDAALSHFLYTEWYGKNARSGQGLQVKGHIVNEQRKFYPIQYISEIIDKYQKAINRTI